MDYSNHYANQLIDGLWAADIPVLDLREEMARQGDMHSQFFRTDHHWTQPAGLWASQIIASTLNDNFGYAFDLSLFEPEKYETVLYPEHLQGSCRRASALYGIPADDLELLYPVFSTDLTFQVPSRNVNSRGDFSITYWYDQLETDKYYQVDTLSTFMYGDNALTTIQNHNNHDGRKTLIIKDSFSRFTIPFLALGTEQIDVIDLRTFNGSLEAYIEQTTPDTVLVMYNPSVLGSDQFFESFSIV